MSDSLAAHYLDEARRQMRGYKRLGEGALSQLDDQHVLFTPDPESNSIAVIIKHLAGNMRSRFTDFLISDGEKPNRHRDQEFELSPQTSRADIMGWWEEGWACVFAAIESLAPEDIDKKVYIRGEAYSILQAINRQIAHYAYHVGQIVFLAKHLKSSAFQSLSIPRGKSEEFNRKGPPERSKRP